ncbi:MAG TPA: peptidylprolyl isomerase [Thermodesulfobacteriota bacterium]|nr:peptidylprolyl isomerase [Thermodesulfobacteriota bacterium]
MSLAKNGDKVKVHFTGKLKSGKVFDSSKDSKPLEFTIGAGEMMPGFEKEIIGMTNGDIKTFTVLPEEAYGSRREELVATVEKNHFPSDITPTIGQPLQITVPDGEVLDLLITSIDGDMVTIDANHPLAGEALLFEVELVGIA